MGNFLILKINKEEQKNVKKEKNHIAARPVAAAVNGTVRRNDWLFSICRRTVSGICHYNR